MRTMPVVSNRDRDDGPEMVKRTPQIPALLDEQEKLTNQLHATIAQLSARLRPVSSPVPTAERPPPLDGVKSQIEPDVMTGLRLRNSEIHQAIILLQDLFDGLEV